MADQELLLNERILKGIELGESHFREFKSAFVRDEKGTTSKRPVKAICTDIGENMVAFANADGGELFVGVEDNGDITGVPHPEDRIAAICQAYRTHVHPDTPVPEPLVKSIEFNGKRVVYFRIAKSTGTVHLTSDGRCLQRFDRGNRPVPAEHIQYDRQEKRSLEYDRAFVPNGAVHHLNRELLESISQHIAPGYSIEKLLQFLDLGEYGPDGLRLRRAALLLFARDIVHWHPRCEVRILRVTGTDIGSGSDYNVVEDDTIRGNIAEILEKGWDTLRPYLARTRFQPNALFRESIIYPEDACREALINAVAHRDYSVEGEPIEILIFDNRMEVRSPGGLLSSLSVQELKELKRAHQSRNVFVSRVLRELGYMREMGEGMRRIFASIRKADLIDPDINSEKHHFAMILYHKSVFSQKDIQWLEGFSEFNLGKDEERVLLLGRDEHLLSTKEIMATLGLVDTEDFRALFEGMRRKGLLYSGKTVATGRKRAIPRFRVRSPQEAQQYLSELRQAIRDEGGFDRLDRNREQHIRWRLSKTNPYWNHLKFSLQALGYIDRTGLPLPRARALWDTPNVPAVSEQASGARTHELVGIVKTVHPEGYAFATVSDGEEFFLHASAFVCQGDFNRVSIGAKVAFLPGERRIPNKPRPAKAIRLLNK